MFCVGCGTVDFQMKAGAMLSFPVLSSGWSDMAGKPCGLFNQMFFLLTLCDRAQKQQQILSCALRDCGFNQITGSFWRK